MLLDLVTPWVTESNGAARVAIVEGDAVGAVSHLTYDEMAIGPLEPAEAIQRIAWAAASGGAHGRRRGAAFGRFMAFYTVATLGGLEWPVGPDDVAATAARLEWSRWDGRGTREGVDPQARRRGPDEGWAAAVHASDLLQEEDEEG